MTNKSEVADRDYGDNKTFESWVNESNELAKKFVYEKLRPGMQISDEYIQTLLNIVADRLKLAGKRLADVMKRIYKKEGPVSNLCPEDKKKSFLRRLRRMK